MEKALLNQDVKLLVAWEFLKLKKGTEVHFIQKRHNGDSHIVLLKGKHKGKNIYIDSSVIELN